MTFLLALLALFFFLILPVMVFVLVSQVGELRRRIESLESKKMTPRLRAEVAAQEVSNSSLEKASGVVQPPALAPKPVELKMEARVEEKGGAEVVLEKREELTEPDLWEPWLEKMGLKPPRPDEEGANPMAWWSTRVGLALGVIAAVFLGLYVNQNTVPCVRLLELVLVALGVFGMGCWFERKLEGFGRTLSAGGLGLLYVAAYAAYGLPAMKVIESPLLGTLVQVGVLVLTAGWSLWRRREAIFGLALVLGYLTSAFAAKEGLEPIPLVALLVLSAGGCFLFAWRNWWSGLWGAVLGSGAGLGILAVSTWGLANGPGQFFVMGAIMALTAFPMVALSWQWVRGEKRARAVVPLVSSIGLLAGAMGYGMRGFNFEVFYACFAVFFFLAGWWWRRGEDEGLWRTLWAKAMVLVALLVIARFEGPVRAFALLGQAAVLIALARTRKWGVFEVGAFLGALLGWIFLQMDTVGSWDWRERGFFLGYLFFSQGLLIAYRFLMGEDSTRRVVGVIFSVLVAMQVMEVSCGNETRMWLFLVPFAFAIFSLVQRWPLKLKDGEWFSFVVLMGTLWFLIDGRYSREAQVSGQLAIWLLGAGAFYGWLGHSLQPKHLVATMFVLLGSLLSFDFLVDETFGREWLGVSFLMLALATHVVGCWLSYKTLRGYSALAALVGTGFMAMLWNEGFGVRELVGLLVAMVWWLWGWRNQEEEKVPEQWAEAARSVVVGVWLWFVLKGVLGGLPLAVIAGVVSALLMVGWRLLGAYSFSWLGLAFSYLGAGLLLRETSQVGFPWVIAFYFLLFAGQGIWLAHGRRESVLSQPKVASVLWGGAAMGIVLYGLIVRMEIASWTTASWAVAAVALLASGFWFGLRGYRLIALAGLGATIVRLFLVDIQDSFWRIVAFGVTGALLVGIGYLYNRFHRRLADGDLDWGLNDDEKLLTATHPS